MLKTFAYHRPSEEAAKKILALREAFSTLAAAIMANAPQSHEIRIALTELETSAMLLTPGTTDVASGYKT
jgi:hypothetical protein